MKKIIKKEKVQELIEKLKKENKKIVFTNGCFDILHVGHVRYLANSSKYGDVLIIGLNSDSSVKKLKGENRPINNENDRAEVLSALSFVDYIIIFEETTPEKLIEMIKPDIYTKGADYTINTLPEAKTVLKNGGKIEFINLVQGKSTTNIIKKTQNSQNC